MEQTFNSTSGVDRLPIPRSNFSMPFWDATRDKRLMLQYCTQANQFQFYPRPVSIFTGRRCLEWREASGRASLFSYTVAVLGPGPFAQAAPYVFAMVELDEGVRMITNLVNVTRADLKVGLRLKVHWLAQSDGTHLPLFEPDQA